VIEALGLLAGERRLTVEAELERHLLRMVALLWDHGWQPSELVRFVRRSSSAAGGRLAQVVVLADHHARDPDTLHPAWAVQVGAMDAPIAIDTPGWVRRWARDGGLFEQPEWMRTAMKVLAALRSCGPIEELIARPGAGRRATATIDVRVASDPVLERVRALLAKAESTTFEAEAEAFTAKAQELMTRHAIDLAMVAEAADVSGDRLEERPATIRIPVDDPYADVKSYLLHVVSEVSRCRAIFHPRYSFTTVIGFAHDLASTDVLFTSLLVQAQTALADAGRHAPPGARTRSRSFKSSFLMGYANRVGDRLEEINRHVAEAAEADAGRSVLPALISRASVVDEEVERRFADTVKSRSRGGHDPLGYHQGVVAAESARLAFADLASGDGVGAPSA
jgi:hypothetical protein